ncbi:MAG: PrsW family intramembrane metalloprotease [Propionibacteriaceae bacterium]|nr:PrsW family intramembrane metalloprotease [Propionibacteriaceae bacterium]
MTTEEVQSYLRRRTGIAASTAGRSLLQRIVKSKWTWVTTVLVIVAGVSLWVLIRSVMASTQDSDGNVIPGLNADALWLSASRALPTLLFWIVCFILVDRFKPQRWRVWFLAVVWGGCIAVTAAYFINTWVSVRMAVVDETSGTISVRVAVFSAPFVEEAMKASVVFLIAAVDRNRFTSRVSGAVIGGLVGAGFAFTENIIYYARVVVYGSYTSGTGDVMAALDYMVLFRGVLTCFGHPLFTLMTGVGIAFAVTTRSKVVRVIAPVTGYLFAAFLHMFFNWWASILSDTQVISAVLVVAWPIVFMVALRVIMSSIAQRRTIQARLTDYVAMGWLPSTYPEAFSRFRTRVWTIIMSLWHGNVIRSWKLQVRATQLAFLREAITRGTVDQGGLFAEHELIDDMAHLSQRGGLVSGRGLRPYWPWNSPRWRRRGSFTPPWGHTQKVSDVVGSPLKYSASDPRWGPPSA